MGHFTRFFNGKAQRTFKMKIKESNINQPFLLDPYQFCIPKVWIFKCPTLKIDWFFKVIDLNFPLGF